MAAPDSLPFANHFSADAGPALEMMPGPESNLGELLLTAAQMAPHEVCVEAVDACWTFLQMAQMAGSIRHVLRKALQRCSQAQAGPTPVTDVPPPWGRRADEHVICVALERGPECLAAVVAVMLERCAYSAFDPGEPREKLRSWVEGARPPVMISSQAVMARLGLTTAGWSLGAYPLLVLDVHMAIRQGEQRMDKQLAPANDPSDLDRIAYVIFTSGSTGAPKAVMIRHRSALNVVRIWGDYVELGPKDRFAQVASMSWDVHIIEVYGSLYKRAASINVPDLVKRSGPDMLRFLRDRHVTGMSVVPSHLRTMSGGGADVSREALPHLHLLDVGGEALGQDVLATWAPGRRMFNSYGPSEITVVCSGAEVQPGDEITIGTELPTYRCYVMDAETLEQKPQGERGVLFVGGVGLARGYLEDEEKTRAKFVEVPGLGRLYNTGDLTSRDAAGRIHYHGRVDWQVKVRGVRIELEALETAINHVPGVNHCEARVLDDGQKLVLIASGRDLDEATLKAAALELGKGYRLSAVHICENSAWKFNASGKLLRNAVLLPSTTAMEGGEEGAGPQGADGLSIGVKVKIGWEAFDRTGADELELDIASCLAPQVLVQSWNRSSHFIEDLGIDSGGFGKLITQLRSKAQLRKVDLQMLFEFPSVASLASCIAERAHSEDSDDEEVDGDTAEQRQETLADLFQASMAASPHAVCCEDDGHSSTYAQVFQLALALQRLLRRGLRQVVGRELRREQVVAVLLETGSGLVAGSMAALLEGCAFSILDPAAAPDELAKRLALLGPVAVLTDAATLSSSCLSELLSEQLPGSLGSCAFVDVAGASQLLGTPLAARRPRRASTSSLCCVTFAEGDVVEEAGQQLLRAVMTDHASACAGVRAWARYAKLTPDDRALLALPLDHAASVMGLWFPLVRGAALLVPPRRPSETASLPLLWCWLRTKRATLLGCAAPHLRALEAAQAQEATAFDEPLKLRVAWVLGGPGATTPELCGNWVPQDLRLLHAYFLPESWATIALESSEQGSLHPSLSYRHSCSGLSMGCHLHVLDSKLRPVAQGQKGALHASGAGVARGYLGLEEETEQSFVDVPGLGLLFNTGYLAMETDAGFQFFGKWTEVDPQSLGMPHSPSGLLREFRSRGRQQSQQSTLSKYVLQLNGDESEESPYGSEAYPKLCWVVQGLVMLSQPIYLAIKLVLMDRLLLPLAFQLELGIVAAGIVGLMLLEAGLKLLMLLAVKWLLIGRYRAGAHDIYSLFYLRHWIVEQMANGSSIGQPMTIGTPVGQLFLKNVMLKLLGADVALSAVVTVRVTGFDLVSIGELATVVGNRRMTAVNYGHHRRMSLAPISIGAGAHVGYNSVVEAGAHLLPGAYLEPLSWLPAGRVAAGRVSGVPAQQVAPLDKARVPAAGAGRRFAAWSCLFAGGSWVMFLPKAAMPILGLLALRWISAPPGTSLAEAEMAPRPSTSDDWRGALPVNLLNRSTVLLLPLLALAVSFLTIALQLLGTLLFVKLTCKVRPPAAMSLTSLRGFITSMKLQMMIMASDRLGDASLASSYLRLCGAKIGKGCAMATEIMLPETVEIGDGCFFATGNVISSMEIDQGQLKFPCKTIIDNNCFMGNMNHIVEGLPQGSFAGVCTWLPKKPTEPNASFFGNPPLQFSRAQLRPESGPEPGSRFEYFWHHFSTSFLDIFMWDGLKSLEMVLYFVVGRMHVPEVDSFADCLHLVGYALGFPLAAWILMSVVIANFCYSSSMPSSNRYFSVVPPCWFNCLRIRKVFKNPIQAAGTQWLAPLLRLQGASIGKNFFCVNEDVLIDPPFARVEDNAIVDYDAMVRNHSFEDYRLKFAAFTLGSGATLMQGAILAMSDAGKKSVLRPCSVTWKGQQLAEGTAYQGSPAREEADPDLEAPQGARPSSLLAVPRAQLKLGSNSSRGSASTATPT